MSKQMITCTCGHRWVHTAPGPLPANLRDICPVCTVAEGGTLVPTPPSGPDTCAYTGFPPAGLAVGETVTGFEIIEEINRGGMGVIYKARQLGLNRIVALKVISPERLGHAETLNRFHREVQAAARLSHPNIVTVYHTDLSGPRPYLAMEFVAGIDLHRLVKRAGPLPPADACAYTIQAAHGLQHAFEQGLVHRDIKPANLMVTPSPLDSASGGQSRPPHVKILDLGLARVADPENDSTAHLTRLGEFLGTPDYIAPEQAEDARKADIRSDLYSLGGTLYFLLTGEAPFPGATLMQRLRRQLTEPPPSPAARRPEVSAELDAVVRLLMAPNPAERFQTPGELAEVLEAILRGKAPGAPVAPSARLAEAEPVVQVRAHTGGVRGLCVSGDGQQVLSGGQDETLRLWDAGRLREVRCIAGDVGPVEGVCLAPNGKWAASCSLRLFKQEMGVQVWDLASGSQRRRLRGPTDTVRCVAIAPDGRRVAAGSADRTVHVWAVDQARSPALCLKGHTDQVSAVMFLPGASGDALLSASHDGTVRQWDAKTGAAKGALNAQVGRVLAVAFGSKRLVVAGDALKVRQADGSFTILIGHEGPVLSVAMSPDGKFILSGGSDGTVRLWRAADAEEVHCFKGHTDKVYAVAFAPDGKAVYSGGGDGTLRRWPVTP
jgi:WD40 repeat protein